MKEYTKILTFVYKGEIYRYYIDNKGKKFFTTIDINEKESYITIEKYLELLKIFSKKRGVKNINRNDSEDIEIISDDNMQNTKKNKKRIIPKVIIGGVTVMLTSFLLSCIISTFQAGQEFKEDYLAIEDVTNSSSISVDPTDPASQDEELEVDTYIDNRDFSKRLYIYDMDYVDMAIDFEEKDLNDFIDVINNNSEIPEKFKPIFIDYCTRVFEKYPDIELRPFYQNLMGLEVEECTEEELLKVTFDVNSVGCYVQSENKIYVLENKDYSEGTWDYQVIFHELSHCLRDSKYVDKDGNEVDISFTGLNYWDIPNAEAINSLFAVSLFDYEEKDIAYQFQSNAHKIMIDCMDNYTLSDYVNHSLTYYIKQLDEYNNDDNYAVTILSLMNAQYEDYHNDNISAPQSEYYPIYDYISKMYLTKHTDENTTYEEARETMDDLVEQLTYDVPEEYNIDTNHFYDYLDQYCESNNIAITQNTK